jgi:hypothetical protein
MPHIVFLFALASILIAPLLQASWQDELKQKVDENNPPAWMLEQIHQDFAPFLSVTQEDLERTYVDDNQNNNKFLVRFSISNNVVLVKTHDAASRHTRSFALIECFQRLSETIELPDVDFIVSLHDCLTYENRSSFKAPVFGFAKHKHLESEIVLMPDFEALLGNYDFLSEVAKGTQAYPWEKKIPMAIWRGATTGGDSSLEYTLENFLSHPRSELVTLSLQFPYLIDARFNVLGQTSEPSSILLAYAPYFAKSINIAKHLPYKYQILIDGNSCAYSRAYWQLFSNCLIFKQDSDHVQWYYRALIPNVHYIPVKNHLEDLIEKIFWAHEHDLECYQISNNATNFANDNLKRSDVMYYFYLLLTEYAKLQNF